MTRTIESATENSAIHKAVLKGPSVIYKISNEESYENKSKAKKLISNRMKHNFEKVLKKSSSNNSKTFDLYSLQHGSNVVKKINKLKKLAEELYGKKLYKTAKHKKSSKPITPCRIVKLPYGCIWSGKEGRFAIRVFSPKIKNEPVSISSQVSTKKEINQSQLGSKIIKNGYDKQKSGAIHKDLYDGCGNANKFLNNGNDFMEQENELQQEVNLRDKVNDKHYEQITEMDNPHRTINLPYGCVWSGKENRFAAQVVCPKVMNGETKIW